MVYQMSCGVVTSLTDRLVDLSVWVFSPHCYMEAQRECWGFFFFFHSCTSGQLVAVLCTDDAKHLTMCHYDRRVSEVFQCQANEFTARCHWLLWVAACHSPIKKQFVLSVWWKCSDHLCEFVLVHPSPLLPVAPATLDCLVIHLHRCLLFCSCVGASPAATFCHQYKILLGSLAVCQWCTGALDLETMGKWTCLLWWCFEMMSRNFTWWTSVVSQAPVHYEPN